VNAQVAKKSPGLRLNWTQSAIWRLAAPCWARETTSDRKPRRAAAMYLLVNVHGPVLTHTFTEHWPTKLAHEFPSLFNITDRSRKMSRVSLSRFRYAISLARWTLAQLQLVYACLSVSACSGEWKLSARRLSLSRSLALSLSLFLSLTQKASRGNNRNYHKPSRLRSLCTTRCARVEYSERGCFAQRTGSVNKINRQCRWEAFGKPQNGIFGLY